MENNDFVFLLTNQYNDKNWFAFLGESMRTGFIHLSKLSIISMSLS
jgi:hypothetical protein